MALIEDYCLIETGECELFQFQDKINWGSPEADRSQGGHILQVVRVAEDLTESFVPVDSAPYLSKLLFDVYNSEDGHYLFELMRFPIYDGNATYIKEVRDGNNIITTHANLVFYPIQNKFYKAKEPSLNIAPDAIDGPIYWTEITDFTHDDIRTNTTITIFDYNDIYTCRSKKCVKDSIIALGCGCEDIKKYISVFRKKALLAGAYALSDSMQSNKAETNLRVLENMCPKC